MRRLVRRLLTYEADDRLDEDFLLEAAERSTEKLRRHMSSRIGEDGVRTLLSRSLTLTKAEFPGISTVQVSKEGALVGLRHAATTEFQSASDSKALTESVDAAVAFLTYFLNLLVIFIGEEITLRMVGTIWPEFVWDDSAGSGDERL